MNTRCKELGWKTGICESCGSFIRAQVVNENGIIYYLKQCKKCGDQKTLISIDVDYYIQSNADTQNNKVANPVNATIGCPYDCGLCDNHKQRVCMAMVETTDDCNIHCNTCIAGSHPGGNKYISVDDLRSMINTVKQAQGVVDLLMLSGGEPTIHPKILELIDLCAQMNVRHTMVISNGVRIAKDIDFVKELHARRKNLEIYLQFDSLRDSTLMDLRGEEVTSQIRREAVENLEKNEINFTLVCILKKGVNDTEVREILQFALSHKYARGVTFQPLKDIGRGNGFEKATNYITLTEARKIIADTGYIPLEEMVPHPCNGNSICIGYLDKTRKPITSFLFEEFIYSASLKQLMFFLPHLDTKDIKYDDLFRITVVAFLDKYNFTLEDVKKCCISFVTSNGRIIPFDTHYVYHNEE